MAHIVARHIKVVLECEHIFVHCRKVCKHHGGVTVRKLCQRVAAGVEVFLAVTVEITVQGRYQHYLAVGQRRSYRLDHLIDIGLELRFDLRSSVPG